MCVSICCFNFCNSLAKFKNGDIKTREKIYKFYLANTKYINNWDLVDLSADQIIGGYLQNKPKAALAKLARSENLWEKRIAIVATFHFNKKGEPKHTLEIAKILMRDNHDLIHKSVGWMLREVGKRCDEKVLTDFLDNYANIMPRTMLRYAIERFPKTQRQKYFWPSYPKWALTRVRLSPRCRPVFHDQTKHSWS